jgi:hypothetical protein
MIEPYIHVTLTGKQLYLLIEAAEAKIGLFENQAGSDYDGEDIDGWDANDIALLKITLEEFKRILESRRQEVQRQLDLPADDN